jgi:hypothetical protein
LIGTEAKRISETRVKSALKPDEILVSGLKHAEQDLVSFAVQQGYKVISVGAGRPHCPTCVVIIEDTGGTPAGARK